MAANTRLTSHRASGLFPRSRMGWLVLALALVAGIGTVAASGNPASGGSPVASGASLAPLATATRAPRPTATPTPCCVDTFNDATGRQSTFAINGPIAPIATAASNPFFQSLGTNGRTCATCHREEDGWTLVTSTVNSLFDTTQGLDPLFRTVDGSNSPTLPVTTTSQRRIAYSMLLSKAVIRVGLPMPANAQFTLSAVDDPYGFASAKQLSLFRRPPPATNLKFLSTVMWDGRETVSRLTITTTLMNQANDATLAHAQATQPLTFTQKQQISTFELGLFSAQSQDHAAGSLNQTGASGGPLPIPTTPFFLGINDPFGGNPNGTPFTSTIFTQFAPWASLPPGSPLNNARLSIARGEALFNTRTFNITGVNGLNDVQGKTTIVGTCGTCHDTPGIGTHSLDQRMNTGVSAGTRRTPDLPLYTFTNLTTTQVISVTDPGVALVTGQWVDVGKFKVPGLRNLAARPPYFHDGSAATLTDVVNFYNARFNIGLSPGEETDLVNFLLAQ